MAHFTYPHLPAAGIGHRDPRRPHVTGGIGSGVPVHIPPFWQTDRAGYTPSPITATRQPLHVTNPVPAVHTPVSATRNPTTVAAVPVAATSAPVIAADDPAGAVQDPASAVDDPVDYSKVKASDPSPNW